MENQSFCKKSRLFAKEQLVCKLLIFPKWPAQKKIWPFNLAMIYKNQIS